MNVNCYTFRMLIGALVILLISSGFVIAQTVEAAERLNVEYHHSEVSFTGDDSFVTGRYTWKPQPTNHVWKEMITFSGGIMLYFELQPGYFYTGANQGKDVFIRSFNSNTNFKRKGHSATEADIIEISNENGNYYLVTSNNSTGSCGFAKQFTGDNLSADGIYPIGTKVASVFLCRGSSWGSEFKLREHIQDIMDRARYDEGKLNKMRAATRK